MSSALDQFWQKSTSGRGRDGDTVMDDVHIPSQLISPFREKFSFDWFSFDGTKQNTSKPSVILPTSPLPTSLGKLSDSSVSPSSYFFEASPVAPSATALARTPIDTSGALRLHASSLVLPSPPGRPLEWMWQCHMCRSRYSLAVTRRCLVDGHYYCSGVTANNQRNNKRRKANMSCTSEFDYLGWQDWGRWCRRYMALKDYVAGNVSGPVLKGCEGCNFPSQCRYENRPAQERIDFEQYVDTEDVKAMLASQNIQIASPDKSVFARGTHKRKQNGPANVNENTRNNSVSSIASETTNVPLTVSKVSHLSSNAVGDSKSILSRRHRFYSGITNSMSNANLISNRDDAKQGKFDTHMPSLSPALPLTAFQINKCDKEKSDLAVMEASLKTTLTSQMSAIAATTPRSLSLPQLYTLSSKANARKRVNSKTDDPEFSAETYDPIKSTVPALQRTASEQSLLTDLFRQVRPGMSTRGKEKSQVERARRAASEADIFNFLRLRDTAGLTAAAKPVDSAAFSAVGLATTATHQHFDEIDLSPKSAKAPGTFTELFYPPVSVNLEPIVDIHPVNQIPSPSVVSLERVTDPLGEISATSGLGLGIPNFGLGRK